MPPETGTLTQRYQGALALAKAGRQAEALAQLRLLDTARPNSPEILFQIGRLEAAQGRPDAAESALRAALTLRPAEAAIWQALHGVLTRGARTGLEREAARAGIILGSEKDARPILAAIEKGKAAEAEAAALRLVKSAPEAFWPAFALGRARAALGNWAGALPPLEMAHLRDPQDTAVQAALGDVLARTGAVIRAEAMLTPLVQDDPQAALALARLLRDTMRPEASADLLQAWTRKRPKARAIWTELALSLASGGQSEAAFDAAARATDGAAGMVTLYTRLASAFEEAGDVASAETAVDAGLARAKTGRAGLLTLRAQKLQSAGDLGAADALLVEAIALDPGYAEAYRAYTAADKRAADDPILARLETALARPDTPSPARSRLHFAAAKAAWDAKDDARAARHLETANRLLASAYPYSFEADLAEARRLVADWTRLAPMRADGPQDPALFVTGLPRSGTTLVETILSAHPQVAAGGEMPFMGRALAPAMDALRGGVADPALFAAAGARYLVAARRRAGGAIFTDKAISTFTRAGHVVRALPGARIIMMRRDPRDVGLSMYRNMFPEGLHRYTNDLQAMGRYIRLHDALAAFWADALPGQVHVVDYEALTADPEPHIRALVAFCGLPWDDACLAPERSQRRVQTLSFAQVRAPIGRQAVAGWTRMEAELQPLIEALDKTRIDLSPQP